MTVTGNQELFSHIRIVWARRKLVALALQGTREVVLGQKGVPQPLGPCDLG